MSSNIWTQCEGDSEIRPLRLTPWRVVEAQHQLSTRKLVANAQEQALLEELIDGSKPKNSAANLHYLLATPFRYPPLRSGSRFGTRHERGIWYGSESRETAFAEVAYYRFVFLEGTRAQLGAVATQLTAFTVKMRSSRCVDLTVYPFAGHKAVIASRVRYTATQALGAAMRKAGVAMVRYLSARDPRGGVNVAAFVPEAFGRSRPVGLETWHCIAARDMIEVVNRDYFGREVLEFRRNQYLVRGVLPAPSL